MATPILPFAFWESGTNQNSIPANDNSLRNQILNGLVISKAVTAQPPSPADGDIYILAATHTGAQWAGFDEDDLVIFEGGTWYAFAPVQGVVVNFEGSQQQFTGSAGWDALAGGGGGGGMTNPMTTAGDVIYGGASGLPTRLAAGTSTYVLTSNGAGVAPSWQAAASGFTNPMTTVGDLIVGGASGAAGRLAAGTSGYVLTSTGAGSAPTWQAAGGGGLTGFTAALNTASPNNTINASSLVASGGTTVQDAAIVPKSTGALLGAIPDGTTTGGNKRGTYAVDLQLQRTAAADVASGNYSVLIGGLGNSATGTHSAVVGSNACTATGANSSVTAGFSSAATGAGSAVTNGNSVTADGAYSRAGGRRSKTRGVTGADVYSSADNSAGEMQRGHYVLNRLTSNATPAIMVSDARSAAAATSNQIFIADFSIYAFTGIVVGRSTGTATQAWSISGAIKRDSGAATTALVGTPTVTSMGSSGTVTGWAVAVTASTSPASLTITVTGDSGSVYWCANVQTAEVCLS